MPHRGRAPAFCRCHLASGSAAPDTVEGSWDPILFMNLSPLYLDPKKLLNIAGRRVSNFLQGYAFYACNGFSN